MTTPNQGGVPPYGEDPREMPNGQLPNYPSYPGGPNNPGAYGNQPNYGGQEYGGDGYGGQEYGGDGYGAPADYSQFEVSSAASASGATALRYHGMQLADGYYGDGSQPHPINDPHANGWAHRKGTGKVRLGEAISWGFKAFFKNPKFWLVLGVIYALLATLSAIPALQVVGVLAGLISFFYWPLITAATLQQTLVVKPQSPSAPAYGKTLGVALVIVVIVSILAGILGIVLFASAFASIDIDPAALPQQPEDIFADEDMMMQLLGAFGVAGGVIFLLMLLLTPFIVYPLYYAADNNGGFGHALGAGIKAGGRAYLPTLGLVLFGGLLSLVAAAPIALFVTGTAGTWIGGLIAVALTTVAAPVSMLIAAHAYRQVSGGPVPYEPTV